jgi:aspartate 1-decarboxylase
MQIQMLASKIHHARITSIDINYIGSITIDRDLLEKAGLVVYQKVLCAAVENGARFETYLLPGEPGSGIVQLNGATGRLACVGDRLIIMAFADGDAPPPTDWQPKVIALGENNQVIQEL